MFTKLLTALVISVVIGASIFNLRQQRLELMHDVTDLQRQMNRDRQETWDTQVRIALRTQPDVLEDALVRAGMTMEPAVAQSIPHEVPQNPHMTNAHYERR